MIDPATVAIGGVSLAVFADIIVKIFKAFVGGNTKWLPVVAVISGIVFMIAANLINPLGIPIWVQIVLGILGGWSSCGAYDLVRKVKEKTPVA